MPPPARHRAAALCRRDAAEEAPAAASGSLHRPPDAQHVGRHDARAEHRRRRAPLGQPRRPAVARAAARPRVRPAGRDDTRPPARLHRRPDGGVRRRVGEHALGVSQRAGRRHAARAGDGRRRRVAPLRACPAQRPQLHAVLVPRQLHVAAADARRRLPDRARLLAARVARAPARPHDPRGHARQHDAGRRRRRAERRRQLRLPRVLCRPRRLHHVPDHQLALAAVDRPPSAGRPRRRRPCLRRRRSLGGRPRRHPRRPLRGGGRRRPRRRRRLPLHRQLFVRRRGAPTLPLPLRPRPHATLRGDRLQLCPPDRGRHPDVRRRPDARRPLDALLPPATARQTWPTRRRQAVAQHLRHTLAALRPQPACIMPVGNHRRRHGRHGLFFYNGQRGCETFCEVR